MQVIMEKVGKIKPYPNNPRVNAAAVDVVANSIKAFGFRQPLVVDAKRTIIVGHTRWLAARKLGMKEVPVHVARMSEKKARAYRLADNKTGEVAEWDTGLLSDELEWLRDDFDFGDFGFDGVGSGSGEKAAPDDFPEVDENVLTEYECPKCHHTWSGNLKWTST